MKRFIANLPFLTVIALSFAALIPSVRPATASGPYTLDAGKWATPDASAQGPLTLGVKLQTAEAGSVTKVRFYKDQSFIGAHTAFVWDVDGKVLAQQTFVNESASGWQEVVLGKPPEMAAGSTFMVGYTLFNGFTYIPSGFTTTKVGPFTILGGYYVYQDSAFPANAYSSNYMIDLTFDPSITSTTTTTSTSTSTTTTTTTTTTTSTTLPPTTTTTTFPPTTTTTSTTTTTTSTTTSTTLPPTTTTTTVPPTTTTTSTTLPTSPSTTGPSDTGGLLDQLASTSDLAKTFQIVSSLLERPLTGDTATALATNPDVLNVVDPDQAAEIFDAIDIGNLDDSQEMLLIDAVNDAPEAVKSTFENSIDVYGSGLDNYVPTGSNVKVGTRRTLIAATTAVSSIAATTGAAVPQSSRGSSDDRGGGGTQGLMNDELRVKDYSSIARRRARSLGSSSSNSRRKSKRRDTGKKMNNESRIVRILTRLAKEISGMAFTLAGSVIVLATLSGQTRKIAAIATAVAMVLHFSVALTKSDTD